MIVVKIEMWPGGSEPKSFEIGRMYIYNVTHCAPRSDYEGFVCRRGVFGPFIKAMDKATRRLKVESYPRSSYNVWRLIARAILSAFPEERQREVPREGPA